MRAQRLLMLLAAFAGTLFLSTGANAEPPVRVGFSLARTGFLATGTDTQSNAYELWKEQVNARGGLDVKGTKRPIEFVDYDDQSDASKSLQIYEKLITNDKVDLLLAPWGSPSHVAVAGVLERYQFPMIGNSASSVKLRELKPGNIWFTSSQMPDHFAAMMVDTLAREGVKSVAIMALQVPYGLEVQSFTVANLKKAGIEIKFNENYPPTIKDMTALIAAAKAGDPDAVLVLSFPADGAIYLRQARELGVNSRFQVVLIGVTQPWFLKEFGESANGIVTEGSWSPDRKDWPRAKPFYDAYLKKFREPPDYLNAVLGYMSCEILEQAVAKAGLDRDLLRKEISSSTFETINGPVKFSGIENAVTPPGLLQIQNGKVEIISPQNIATAGYVNKRAWPQKQ